MSAVACNFALLSTFNAMYDVTWSFQYSLCGVPASTAGFTTFVFDGNVPILTGGLSGDGLGYGVSGALMGVGFDSTGMFGTTGTFTTGAAEASANTATMRISDNFTYQGSFVLPFDVVETTEVFKTLRFNLTDVGQTLRIHQYDDVNRQYNLIGVLSTGYVFATDTPVKIGVSVATPVSGDLGCVFKIKDFHHQGKLAV